MKRTLAVLALTGSLALMGGSSAMAVTYTAPAPAVTVSDATVAPGEDVIFSGSGFTPGETVLITVALDSASDVAGGGLGARSVPAQITLPTEVQNVSTIAAPDGTFSLAINLDAPGVYTLTATGETSGRTQSALVTVEAPAAAPAASPAASSTDDLAETGADSSLYIWGGVGAAALLGGAASVVIARRRVEASDTV